MKKCFIYILILLLGTSCDKMEDGDLSGSEKVIGRLFLSDPFANVLNNVPQANKKLIIRYADSQDPVNYIFSTSTDANGYFEFSNLKKNRPYVIKYQETIGGTMYEDSVTVEAPNNKVVLIGKLATSKQAGVLVEVRDFSGNLLKDASVCVFTSDNNIGYLTGKCEGNIFKLTTNSAGKANQFGLAAGSYYLLATITIDGVLLTSRTKVDIGNSIVEVKMQVQKPRGINLTVTDYNGGLLKDAEVCLFNSATSRAYEEGLCDGSLYKLTTDPTGTARFSGIPAGTYYALVNATQLLMPLQGKQVITVTDKVEESKITLARPNGIQFITTDANSGPIGDVNICVFTSSVLFEKNSCDGSSIKVLSNAGGKTNLYKLEKGTYYIFASKVVGTETLIAKNTVTVDDQIVEVVLKLVKK